MYVLILEGEMYTSSVLGRSIINYRHALSDYPSVNESIVAQVNEMGHEVANQTLLK